MSNDIVLWGLKGDSLEAYAGEIETLSKANGILTQFHASRKAAIESGETPSVEETLASLG